MLLKKNGVIRETEDSTKIKYLKSIGYGEVEVFKQEKTAKLFDINTAKAGELLAYAAELGEGYEEIAALPKNTGADKIREALLAKIEELKATE